MRGEECEGRSARGGVYLAPASSHGRVGERHLFVNVGAASTASACLARAHSQPEARLLVPGLARGDGEDSAPRGVGGVEPGASSVDCVPERLRGLGGAGNGICRQTDLRTGAKTFLAGHDPASALHIVIAAASCCTGAWSAANAIARTTRARRAISESEWKGEGEDAVVGRTGGEK